MPYFETYLEVTLCLISVFIRSDNCNILIATYGYNCALRNEFQENFPRGVRCVNPSTSFVEVHSVTVLLVH